MMSVSASNAQTDLSQRLNSAKLLATHGQCGTTSSLVEEALKGHKAAQLRNDDIETLIWLIQYCYSGHSRLTRLEKLRALIAQNTTLASANGADLFAAELSLALQDHDEFLRLTTTLTENTHGNFRERARSLLSIREKLASPHFPDYRREIIFGIGLSRTGTSSLNSALKELGFWSIHWANPHTKELIQWHDFFLFDGFTDISVAYQFETLYYAFPNSQFVYTNRDLDSWVHSVSTHYERRHGITKPSDLSSKVFQHRLNFSAGWIEQSLYAQHVSWADSYIEFDRRVRAFFDDKPPGRFMELRICEGDEWQKLCAFLGKDVPTTDFPHKHKARISTQSMS